MPDRASVAYLAIAGTSRVNALRFLFEHPASTVAEIAEGIGVSLAAARTSIADLEAVGYVSADVEGKRMGRVVRYSAHRRLFVDDLSQLWSWLVR